MLRGLSLCCAVVFGVALTVSATDLPSKSKTKKSSTTKKAGVTSPSKKSSSGRASLSLRSADPYLGALVVDAATGQVLFENNADARGYPASVTKLMDMMVMLDRIQAGQLSLTNMVTVTSEASKVGGTQVWLAGGEVFSLDDLMYALMIQSANDAAVAMAFHVAGSKEAFVELMNKKAGELGMTNTTYGSVHGLPPNSGQNADSSTPRDLAKLACALIAQHPEILKYTSTAVRSFREGSEHKVIMRNHNHLLNSVTGCDGLKTGFISAGGFSLVATAQRNGRRVVAVVLGSKDRKVRDARAAELIGKGFAALPPLPPPPPPPALTNLPPAAPVTEEPPPPPAHSRWLTYSLVGMASGLVLLGVGSFVLKKKSTREF